MKAVITKSQYNRIKNFINETKEVKKEEVLGEKKKLTKKQLDTFDVDNDGKPFEPRDLAALRASKKLSKELDEGSDCGCGEDKDDTRYMFFSNLEQMMRQAKMLLDMDEDAIEDLLNNGHDWAADHIAEAKNNMDQVFDFIMGEMNGEGEDDDWDNEEDDDEDMMYEGNFNIQPDRQGTDKDAKLRKSSSLLDVDGSKKRDFVTTKLSNDDFAEYFKAKALGKENEFLRNRGFDNSLNTNLPSINEGMSLKKKAFVSKELKNHLDKNIPLSESEFRSGSPKHIELLKEVKELYNKGIISLNETDEFIVNEFDPKPIKVKGVGEVYLGLILEDYESDEQLLSEAVYQGRKVKLGKPFLTPDGPKKRSVYVRNDKGNVVKVNFGDPNMRIKKNIPERRKSFRARHKCSTANDKTSAKYWSCRAW